LLFYLIFEDFTENVQAATRAFKNATSFDFMVYISKHPRSSDLKKYFDINRMMKLRDKFNSSGVITVMENVVDKLVQVSEQVNSKEFIYRSKTHLIELASASKCKP
jgi:hypothetical protein